MVANKFLNSLESAFNRLGVTVDTNKQFRKVCHFGSDDVLLQKNLFAFLEDLVHSLRKLRLHKAWTIEKELKENQRLTKEWMIENLETAIKLNADLSGEVKQSIMKNLENKEVQEDLFKILSHKERQFSEEILREKENILSQNPSVNEEELKASIEEKLEGNEITVNDVIKALEDKSEVYTDSLKNMQFATKTDEKAAIQTLKQNK